MKKLMLAFAVLASAPCLVAHDAAVPQVPVAEWTYGWWMPRFEAKRAEAMRTECPFVFVGDSITHGWEGAGKAVWQAHFATGDCRAFNCGFNGDRTEHVLWRIEHGQFGTMRTKAFVLMIGTNNTGQHALSEEAPVDTIGGIVAVVRQLRDRYPESKVILHPIFPRGADTNDALRVRNEIVNSRIRGLADGKSVAWCDFNARLLDADGTLSRDMMPDLLHPSEKGYEIWAAALKPYLDWALGKGVLPEGAASRDGDDIGWFLDGRAQRVRDATFANRSRYFDLVFVGDSISHYWDREGLGVWQRHFCGLQVLDIAFSGDRVDGAVWKCGKGGYLDGYRAGLVSVMIGTNDMGKKSPEEIAAGVGKLLDVIRRKQPDAKIILTAILPRGWQPGTEIRQKVAKTNALLRPFADGRTVMWLDLGDRFVEADGTISRDVLYDALHPTAKGYEIWAEALGAYLK